TVVPEGEPNVARTDLRRLTRRELSATITDLTGLNPDPELVRALPDDSTSPFDNDASVQSASAKLITAVNALAEDVATRVVADAHLRDQLVGCVPSGADDAACFGQFVAHFGRLAFRRPLSETEVSAYQSALLPFATSAGDFYAAVEPMIAA